MKIRKVTTLLLFLGCLAPLWSIGDLISHNDVYKLNEIEASNAIFYFRIIQILIGAPLFYVLLKKLLHKNVFIPNDVDDLQQLRLLLCIAYIALLFTSIANGYGLLENNKFFLRSFFNTTAFLFLTLWCYGLIKSKDTPFLRHSFFLTVEITVFNLVVIMLFSEIALNIYSKYSPNPLLWDQSSIQSRIEAFKMKPGQKYFNTYLNSQGYHDSDFFKDTDSDFVVAMLADSFGLGIVPYEYNFSTIAEKILQNNLDEKFNRVAIHNFGIGGIGIDDYAYLLNSEVKKIDPDVVMVAVFIGNDLIDVKYRRRVYYCFQNWMIYQLPKRIFTIYEEKKNNKEFNVTTIGNPLKTDEKLPDYLTDWRKEKPSMSKEVFLRYERDRLEICDTKSKSISRLYDHFFKIMRHFQGELGDKLFVVLIPDEFQVNDSLFNELIRSKSSPENYIRDFPQSKIGTYFDEQNIKFIDLLPILKKSEKEGRTYHLQNTHWNSRGNAIAGKEIGNYILKEFF